MPILQGCPPIGATMSSPPSNAASSVLIAVFSLSHSSNYFLSKKVMLTLLFFVLF